MKNTIVFLSFLLVSSLLFTPAKIYAEEKSSVVSASFTQVSEAAISDDLDIRAQILHAYLRENNSPLAPYAQNFVAEADKNNLDWKLLPAISGVESTFGNAEPAGCNNAWGYNIYGDFTRCFASYDAAITVITRDLRQLYMNQWGAKDVWTIGRLYAASPTWAYRVNRFMVDLGQYAITHDNRPLPISL